MVIIDALNEKERMNHVADSYAHIFSRSAEFPEMKQIVEPPMHVDSKLSANVQFADWVSAFVNRCIDWHLISQSRYGWITESKNQRGLHRCFTYESKLHLLSHRPVPDLNHSEILRQYRPLFDDRNSNSIGSRIGVENIFRIKAAADRANDRG